MEKQSLESLRWRAEFMGEFHHLPKEASKKLKELVLNDCLTAEEFEREMTEILKTSKTLTWEIKEALLKINPWQTFKNLLITIPWSNVLFWTIFFVLVYFLYNKFKSNKVISFAREFFLELIYRFCCVSAYFFPFLEIMNTYAPPLVRAFPYLKWILGSTIQISLFIYTRVPIVSFWYFCIVFGFLIRNRLPRNRLIRFHLALGLLIINLHAPVAQIYQPMFKSLEGNKEAIESLSIVFSLNVLVYFLPCVYRAASGQYIKNEFIRDAVEIILGRDSHDPNFKWWDR